jgi:hypothetical protein
MPAVIPFIPLIAAGVSTAGGVYAANKSANAAKLPKGMAAAQAQAQQLANTRMQSTQPLFQQLMSNASNRMAGASRTANANIGGGQRYRLPSMTRSPGTTQAISAMARSMPGPGRRRPQMQ